MKIKAILDTINSAQDNSGSCYWAFRWTDTETGKQVCATISGNHSNIHAIIMEYYGEWTTEVYCTSHELQKREFKRVTGDWPYAGCCPKELAKFVKDNLDKVSV